MVLNKCDTNDQSADIFTKSFTDEVKWKHACSLIHMGRSVKDPVAVPEEKKSKKKVASAAAAIACCCLPLFQRFREEARPRQEHYQSNSHFGKRKEVEEPIEEPCEEKSRSSNAHFGKDRSATPHSEKTPAPNYSYTSTAPAADDVPAWEKITRGNHMMGPQGVNIMASPREWGDVAKWFEETLRTRHPRHFRPEDFLIIRERLERHRERSGDMSEMKITIFEEYTEESLFLGEAGVCVHDDDTLCTTSCIVWLGIHTSLADGCKLHRLHVQGLEEETVNQLFTHPHKIGNSAVADHWPADDLADSAKFMSSEMSYLKALSTKILDEAAEAAGPGPRPANATPAGGGGPSTSSSSTRGGNQGNTPKRPPPDFSRPQAKPPPPEPGRRESAPPGTGPPPKTNPPKRPPPGAPNDKPSPAPPPQKVIEPENMPQDKSMSMNANVRWMENLLIYGAGEPWTNLEPIWHREDIDEAYKAGMCSFSIWWAQRIAFLCRMYHIWTDIRGIDRLYKPAKGDRRPLLQRVADESDEFERVCDDFRANEDVGQVFPTLAEMHVLTRMKGIGYQTETKELTGSRDPKFYQMFLN
eukprot:6218129-Amphidinium_carterae.1